MGNGDVIECTANTALSKMTYGGICKTKLSQRKWTHWAKTSWLTYEAEKKVEVPETYAVKKGDILSTIAEKYELRYSLESCAYHPTLWTYRPYRLTQ